jgi:hypothetical protein
MRLSKMVTWVGLHLAFTIQWQHSGFLLGGEKPSKAKKKSIRIEVPL